MRWVKKGHIFSVSGEFGWMNSHAQIPTAVELKGGVLRVFFSTRETPTKSRVAMIDLDLAEPSRILKLWPEPLLRKGDVGTFDEHGTMPSSALFRENKLWLYYSGWSRRVEVPYNNLTGLATSEDGEHFERKGRGPILSQTLYEPFSATSPFVFREGRYWHMFYCSGTSWKLIDDKYEHQYDIKYASSNDGVHWYQNGKSIISCSDSDEAITRPTVIKIADKYHMWFCYRGSRDFRDGKNAYRIGYAWSDNLDSWTREDERAGISVSETGWDSKALSYPYVLRTSRGVLLFYNGNGFGTEGFGYAALTDIIGS